MAQAIDEGYLGIADAEKASTHTIALPCAKYIHLVFAKPLGFSPCFDTGFTRLAVVASLESVFALAVYLRGSSSRCTSNPRRSRHPRHRPTAIWVVTMVATVGIGLAAQICLGQTTRGARAQYTRSRRPPTLPACLILLAQLYHCIPQVLGHAAVAELLGLVDTPLISDAGLVPTPDLLEGIAQT